MTMPITYTSFRIGKTISQARGQLRQHFWKLVLMTLIMIIPSVVNTIIETLVQQIPGTASVINHQIVYHGIWSGIMPVLGILFNIIQARLGLGYIKAMLKFIKGENPDYHIIWSTPWTQVVRLIGASLVVIVPIIVIGLGTLYLFFRGMGGAEHAIESLGLIALLCIGILIIGVIIVAIRISLLQFFIVKNYGIIESIKASWCATRGNFWKITGITILYALFVFVGVLLLLVGLLAAVPLVALSQAFVFQALKQNAPKTLKPTPKTKLIEA